MLCATARLIKCSPVLIVLRALALIGEYLVRLVDLLEFLLIPAFIGMKFVRKFAVRFFHLIL